MGTNQYFGVGVGSDALHLGAHPESSRGKVSGIRDGFIKPDITAPGTQGRSEAPRSCNRTGAGTGKRVTRLIFEESGHTGLEARVSDLIDRGFSHRTRFISIAVRQIGSRVDGIRIQRCPLLVVTLASGQATQAQYQQGSTN